MQTELLSCPARQQECCYLDELKTLRKQVITDPLTGLFNVRYFRDSLESELERTRRTGMSTCLMIIDLDHFKSVNDTHGHENGNRVLVHVAELLRSQTRKLDVCCRYGGEEFVIILPSTELMLAQQVAERCRSLLESSPVMLDGGSAEDTGLTVTASIGLAVCSDADQLSAVQLIELADQCLYKAKRNGRNQVVAHRQERPDHRVSEDEKAALRSMFGGD